MTETQFTEFPKMARLSREVIITEKIDGTNASIFIYPLSLEEIIDDQLPADVIDVVDGFTIRAGSRSKYITPKQDNYGFAAWVKANSKELVKLGEGRHFGEWWGSGIQRGYGMKEKVFSLFNVERWTSDEIRPACCRVVPELWRGSMDDVNQAAVSSIELLRIHGSQAAPKFMNPEGIVIYHTAGNVGFKKTIDKDELPKTVAYGKGI